MKQSEIVKNLLSMDTNMVIISNRCSGTTTAITRYVASKQGKMPQVWVQNGAMKEHMKRSLRDLGTAAFVTSNVRDVVIDLELIVDTSFFDKVWYSDIAKLSDFCSRVKVVLTVEQLSFKVANYLEKLQREKGFTIINVGLDSDSRYENREPRLVYTYNPIRELIEQAKD